MQISQSYLAITGASEAPASATASTKRTPPTAVFDSAKFQQQLDVPAAETSAADVAVWGSSGRKRTPPTAIFNPAALKKLCAASFKPVSHTIDSHQLAAQCVAAQQAQYLAEDHAAAVSKRLQSSIAFATTLQSSIDALIAQSAENDKQLKAARERCALLETREGIDAEGNVKISELDAASTEFLAVEAHFYKNQAQMYSYAGLTFDVVKVERVENKPLRQQFGRSMAYFYEQGHPSAVEAVYHGTHPDNIDSILRENLKLHRAPQLDKGWFGRGFYFSRFPDYTMQYRTTGAFRRVRAGDRLALLRFDVLPGRSEVVTSMKMGALRESGVDSHKTARDFELVMFDARHFVPTHVIHVYVRKAHSLSFPGSLEQLGPDYVDH